MEEIIKSITEAEAQAAEIKAQALKKATEIAEKAEERAAELQKISEAECKKYREEQLEAARNQAEQRYNFELAEKRAEAKNYAEKCINNTEFQVTSIVRRISGGGC